MAVTDTPSKYRVNARFNNGLDPDGNVKTFGVSLGTLSLSGYTDSKALAIASALENCYSQQLYSVEKVATSFIEEE